jgi:hypothetical protein
MTYSQLREEIASAILESYSEHGTPAETAETIMTAIDTYLEEKAVEVEGLEATSDTLKGFRAVAATIIRSKE